jgi:hypothetical protein
VRGEIVTAHGLAGFRAAKLENVTTRRCAAEVVIEGHDPMHLRARQVERVRHQRHGLLGHVAEGLLQRMEDWKRRARAIRMLTNDLGRALARPAFVPWHARSRSLSPQSPMSVFDLTDQYRGSVA